jgi:O-acetyl-ADP-ribose deacetylase (regulator of RNase III)
MDMSDVSVDDELLPSKIYLIDHSAPLVEEWKKAFSAFPEVVVLAGDYFQQPADAIVSPANSFGIMDGGLDLALREQLGHVVQARLQRIIVERYHGELPIGAAEIVETNDARWKFMVAAPTMRIPEPVASSINAYLAFRAILVAIENFNQAQGRRAIDSVVCCGLGTGVGRMGPSRCAAQMRIAYNVMLGPPIIGRFESIHELHRALQST